MEGVILVRVYAKKVKFSAAFGGRKICFFEMKMYDFQRETRSIIMCKIFGRLRRPEKKWVFGSASHRIEPRGSISWGQVRGSLSWGPKSQGVILVGVQRGGRSRRGYFLSEPQVSDPPLVFGARARSLSSNGGSLTSISPDVMRI